MDSTLPEGEVKVVLHAHGGVLPVAPGSDLLEPPLHAAAFVRQISPSQGPKVQAAQWI